MSTSDLTIGTGFYLMPHSLVTHEGNMMPIFRRVRDDFLYVLTAEPVDENYALINDDDIVTMGACNAYDALDKGSLAYYTTTALQLNPYSMFQDNDEDDYRIFAVRISDLYYDTDAETTMILKNKRLTFVENRFPSMESESESALNQLPVPDLVMAEGPDEFERSMKAFVQTERMIEKKTTMEKPFEFDVDKAAAVKNVLTEDVNE